MSIKLIFDRRVAHGPALKSCWSLAKTREDPLCNIREAAEHNLEAAGKLR
jgi:predicted RNase H-like HicB family nuclease